LTWRPGTSSSTFHGRDIMSPVAGMIAAGHSRSDLIGQRIDPILLDMHLAKSPDGEVIHIDHFGNATTNIPAGVISTHTTEIQVRDLKVPLRRTYADVHVGESLGLIGSSNLLEIAVRNGSAADQLNLRIGDRVTA
jgi:S-adenosylmethionine hydrolase